MRTNGALVSLLFLSSACVGRVFADGIAGDGREEGGGGGGGGGDTPPQDLTRIQNQHAGTRDRTRVPQGDDNSPTTPHHDHHESTGGASVSSTSATDSDADAATATAADTAADTIIDAACSAVDGASCSSSSSSSGGGGGGVDAEAAGVDAEEAAAETTLTSKDKDEQDEPHQRRIEEEEEEAEGAVKVEIGEQDGVRIEFVGRAEGTIPEPERPASSASSSSKASSGRDADAVDQQVPAAAAAAAAAAAEMMKFELLRCDGESYRDGTEGGLTAKGVWSHLRSKLETSWEEGAQWIAPNADAASGEGAAVRTVDSAVAGGSDGAGSSSSGGGGGGGGGSVLGQALAVTTAPLSGLFRLLGRVPGWFSDTVFEVTRKDDGPSSVHLQDHLVLVQSPPRFIELACSMVTPSLPPRPPPPADAATGDTSSALSPSAAYSAGTWLVPRLVRRFCSADGPFPGKVVSRPCRDASGGTAAKAQQQQQQQRQEQERGWVPTFVGEALSAMGFGGGGGWVGAGVGGGVGVGGGEPGGVCVCLGGGGGGKCTIRAPPGRDPCLYVETTGGSRSRKGEGGSGSGSGSGSGFGGVDTRSVEASSAVELRTYNLATATNNKRAERGRATAAPGGLAALHAAAAERGLLPSTIAVPVYAAMLVAGVVLLLLAQPLSESRVFHYLLSVLLGAGFLAAALVLPVVRNPRRSFLRLLLASGLVTWLVVAAGVDLIPSPAELLANLPGAAWAFWCDGFTSCPWAGKASFAAAGLAGVVMTRWQGLFLEEGDGSRGSWFNGQACIRRALSVSGVFLVYHSVSDTDVAVALVVLSLATPTLAHYVRRYNMWSNSSRWYRAGNVLSQDEYEAQGDEYTRQAIAALRESAGEDWSVVKKLKNQSSRKRMTLFVQSGQHYADRGEPEGTGNGWNCTVQ